MTCVPNHYLQSLQEVSIATGAMTYPLLRTGTTVMRVVPQNSTFTHEAAGVRRRMWMRMTVLHVLHVKLKLEHAQMETAKYWLPPEGMHYSKTPQEVTLGVWHFVAKIYKLLLIALLRYRYNKEVSAFSLRHQQHVLVKFRVTVLGAMTYLSTPLLSSLHVNLQLPNQVLLKQHT